MFFKVSDFRFQLQSCGEIFNLTDGAVIYVFLRVIKDVKSHLNYSTTNAGSPCNRHYHHQSCMPSLPLESDTLPISDE